MEMTKQTICMFINCEYCNTLFSHFYVIKCPRTVSLLQYNLTENIFFDQTDFFYLHENINAKELYAHLSTRSE